MALGLALLAALAVGVYFAFGYVFGVFSGLSGQTGILAAIASIVTLLCALIVAGGLTARGRSEQQVLVAREKAVLYEDMLGACVERMEQSGPCSDSDGVLHRLERALALRGSGKVIAAYVALRGALHGEAVPDVDRSALLRTLTMEMRADLGSLDANRRGDELLTLLLERP